MRGQRQLTRGLISRKARKFWAFQPVKRWPSSSIDGFILAKLEENLAPAARG